MSRACCCSVSHVDAISSIITIQRGADAILFAKLHDHDETVEVLKLVLCGLDGV